MNLLLEFIRSHVYSQHEVVNDCKSTVPFKFLQLILIRLDLCFELINGSLIWYASFTNEIFGQLLSNCSRYAANLNMKAVSFFYSPCIKKLNVWNFNHLQPGLLIWQFRMLRINEPQKHKCLHTCTRPCIFADHQFETVSAVKLLQYGIVSLSLKGLSVFTYRVGKKTWQLSYSN